MKWAQSGWTQEWTWCHEQPSGSSSSPTQRSQRAHSCHVMDCNHGHCTRRHWRMSSTKLTIINYYYASDDTGSGYKDKRVQVINLQRKGQNSDNNMNNVPVHTKIPYLQIKWLTLVPRIHSRHHLQQDKDSRRFSFDIPRNFKWWMEQHYPQFPEKSTHSRFPKVYFRKRPFLVIFISEFSRLDGSRFISKFWIFHKLSKEGSTVPEV